MMSASRHRGLSKFFFFRHSLCSTGSDWCEEPDEYPVDLAANIIKKMKQESESDGGIDDAAVLKKKTKTAAVKNGLDGGAATSAVSSRKMKQKTLMSTFFLPIVDGQVFTEDGEVIRSVTQRHTLCFSLCNLMNVKAVAGREMYIYFHLSFCAESFPQLKSMMKPLEVVLGSMGHLHACLTF
jgi:hypothetical protein